MNINLSNVIIKKEGSMNITAQANELTFTWNGGQMIGAQASLLYDLTGIDTITCDVVTTTSYSDTTERFKVYMYIASSLYNPTSQWIQDQTAYIEKSEVFSTRNSTHTFNIDVSDLTGEHYIIFNAHGWNCTFSNCNAEVSGYTVKYNANGGLGTMPDDLMLIDTPTALSLCTFTKQGFMFSGWATSSGGAVVYSDGETVENLAGSGETITLYAVWTPERLRCILQTNKSENNRAVKTLENVKTFNFTLKDGTSIIDPVLIISAELQEVIAANYMTIPLFGRKYFITNIESLRKDIVLISAHVDVLSTYIDQLTNCEGVVHRQENKWNLYLDDGFFKTYQNPNIVVKKFPQGFTSQSFILAVAGD